MSGTWTLAHILSRLQTRYPANVRVWLMPLLGVVGKHVQRDMAGAGPESWGTRIGKAGFTCMPVLRGLMEYKGFSDLWISHLEEAWARL